MTSELHLNEKLLYVAEKASWDWYTKQVKEFVTPKDAVQYSINMATGWTSDNNISNTFAYTLRTPSYLRLMDIPIGESDAATKAVMISWHIVRKRAWTFTKYACPPEAYAGILSSDDPDIARDAAAKMKTEHHNFLALEKSAHIRDGAQRLRADIMFLDFAAIRIVFEMFAKDILRRQFPARKH